MKMKTKNLKIRTETKEMNKKKKESRMKIQIGNYISFRILCLSCALFLFFITLMNDSMDEVLLGCL